MTKNEKKVLKKALQTALKLRRALLDVQEALACDRDQEVYKHRKHGKLVLEEVKYCIVDEALENDIPIDEPDLQDQLLRRALRLVK